MKNSENLLRGIHSKKYETLFSQVDDELITFYCKLQKQHLGQPDWNLGKRKTNKTEAETSIKLLYKKRLVFKYHNYRIKEEEKKREKTNVQR